MIDRYPHSISVKEQTASPKFDQNGDPVPASGKWSRRVPCRYETDGRSNIQVQEDGSLKTYAYVVYLRPTGTRIDFTGRVVRLFDARGAMVCECLVHHANALQMSTVLYVERCL